MKIVFNTRHPQAASSQFYAQAFGKIAEIRFYDWEAYNNYDIALFMAYGEDLADALVAKQKNPRLRLGLIDPRASLRDGFADIFDFLVVDGIEMRDFFSRYGLPIHTYHEYFEVPAIPKQHREKERIILGYHGNKVHLEGMFPRITQALEQLGEEFSLELWAMYNVAALGEWTIGVPRNITVKHIQWSEENYTRYLAQVDIGLVPAFTPIRDEHRIKKKSVLSKRHFLDTDDDYLLKFKVSSGPNRLIVFCLLGIPIVADMVPSALQFIRDGESGCIACSTAGWYHALKKLIQSPELRQRCADRAAQDLFPLIDHHNQNAHFLDFLATIVAADRTGPPRVILPAMADSRLRLRLWREDLRTFIHKLKKRVL